MRQMRAPDKPLAHRVRVDMYLMERILLYWGSGKIFRQAPQIKTTVFHSDQ